MVKGKVETRDWYQTYDPISGIDRKYWRYETYDLIGDIQKTMEITWAKGLDKENWKKLLHLHQRIVSTFTYSH